MQGASVQCMQATEMERSPGTPSFPVTSRRRFTPHGTSCSFLHAVTQLLHSMHRSASQMNFIRAMSDLLGSARCGAGVHTHRMCDGSHAAFSRLQIVVLVSCIMVTLS